MSAKNPPLRPARLFVLLAREAPVGVILRRGPKDWVQMIKWHTDTDKFEAGQWLRGEVSEYSGDLSPDGKLLLYDFFHKRLANALEMQKLKTDKILGYLAVSKPPYFTALALWEYMAIPDGQFINNSTIRFYDYRGWHPTRTVPQLNIDIQPYEGDPIYQWVPNKDIFMVNQGWQTVQIGKYAMGKFDPPYIWSKSSVDFVLNTSYALYESGQKQGGSHNQFTYSISMDEGKTQTVLKGVNWADFDQQGRLVLAKHGKLFSGAFDNGDLKLTELADFNANKPDPQPAPDWAQKW
ncbi:MAG: hypothetical protein ABI970_22470 [Chloroflexota bacterium]